jgi:hypothetical protein
LSHVSVKAASLKGIETGKSLLLKRGSFAAQPGRVAANGCLLVLVLVMASAAVCEVHLKTKTKLHGLSPRANYTDRATAACR